MLITAVDLTICLWVDPTRYRRMSETRVAGTGQMMNGPLKHVVISYVIRTINVVLNHCSTKGENYC